MSQIYPFEPTVSDIDAGACVIRNRELVVQQILTVSNYECVNSIGRTTLS